MSKKIEARFKLDNFYFGRHNYLCNLGYSKNVQTSVEIIFERQGTYTLDEIKVYCYPMKNYPEQVNALKEEILENITIGTNRVTGEINVSDDKFLIMSIPYSKGWSAKVNGQNVELLKANTMFIALPLSSGNHVIEIVYCTPGIKLGVVLSAIGIVIFIVFLILYRRNRTITGDGSRAELDRIQ